MSSPLEPAGSGLPAERGDDPLLAGLNPPQREAVEYRGPALLIVAGAGSGKTRVLTHRIAHLIRNREAWPSQILSITFTNKAAGEMRERVAQLLGQAAEGMWISTFHSACVRILRRQADRFGFTQAFSIYDSQDSRALLKRIIKSLEADVLGFTPGGAAAKISTIKNELADVDSYARNVNLADPREVMFLEIFRQYSRALSAANAFDFDDLISQTVFLFRAFPEVAAHYRRRFRHLLVDEYQDTNHAQYALIHELTRPVEPEDIPEGPRIAVDENGRIPAASLTVVGDSDQSIYAFRGADIRNITEFERDFPGAHVVLLEQNYRSTQNILSAANAVIGNNFDRKDKKLWTSSGDGEKIIGFTAYGQHDEAQFVADEINRLHREGLAYQDVAVFYRTNAQTRALEDILIRSGLPYRVLGGTKFYERAEIKDALAYLIAVANPRDALSVRRILNVPKRGIGPATETQLAVFAEERQITLIDALREAASFGFGPKVTGAMAALSQALDEASRLAETGKVHEVLTLVLDRSGYLDALRNSRDDQDAARLENLTELVAQTREFARNNPDGTLVDYLAEVQLVAAVDELDDESGTVSLMTLHTAKGLEFDTVFITGLEEGLLPHTMSAHEPGGLAEERRLFYVGITRARRRLFLSLAMTRAQFGGIGSAAPSRYLQEVPSELIEWREGGATGLALGPGGSEAGYGSARYGSAGYGSAAGRSEAVGFAARTGSSSGGFRQNAASQNEWLKAPAAKKEWPNKITAAVRDNGDLILDAGDRIRHTDFGEGRVLAVTGQGAKRVAEVDFATAGRKKLLIKIAPIDKL